MPKEPKVVRVSKELQDLQDMLVLKEHREEPEHRVGQVLQET